MISERRASERDRPRSSRRLRGARAAGNAAAFVALAMGVLAGGCRQTVLLDPSAAGAAGQGGAGDSGAPPVDAARDGERMGAAGFFGGGRFDGGRFDLPPTCVVPLQSLQISMRSPTIIVSVDRSTSMQTMFGSVSRLEVIQNEVLGVLGKYHFVKFGYEEFPSATSMCSDGQGCCAGDVALPNYSNRMAINHAIHACDGGGAACSQSQRPIAAALEKCFTTFQSLYVPGDPGHRYVILFTSGDPTCMGSDPMMSPCDDASTEVVKLGMHNTNTAVFGVGDGITSNTCLDALARYGNLPTGTTSPVFHLVKTPNDLSSAFEDLVQSIADEACKIDVRTPPADSTTVQLRFDGMLVPTDSLQGWMFDPDTNNTSLTVRGKYCDMLTQSTTRVDLLSGCPNPH
jgi:hypothetical protein